MNRHGAARCVSIIVLTTLMVASGSHVASSVPPPPPNPSDEELHSGRSDVRAAAERVGRLASRVAAASDEVTKAQIQLAERYEQTTAAQRKHRAARAAVTAAEIHARQTRVQANAAAEHVRRLTEDVDKVAASSYQHRGTLGVLSALVSSTGPRDVLTRSALLNVIGQSRLNTLENMRRARIEKSNLNAAARAALQDVKVKKRAAEEALIQARSAYAAAVEAEEAAKSTRAKLVARESALKRQFSEARRVLVRLTNQARDYEAWQRARQAAERRKARPAPSAPSPNHQHATVGYAPTRGVVAPTTGVITSTYGPRWGTIHYGLDIANGVGTPIVSVMSGTVISSGPASGFGLWVRVRHDDGIITVYGHINETLVWVGQRVGAGQQIATVGNRGESTGPHLHFEVHQRGFPVDPLFWLRRNGVSI